MPGLRETALSLVLAFAGCLATMQSANAQLGQGADLSYRYANDAPAYAEYTGPVILFGADNSVFVRNGSHRALAALALGDGFRVAEQQQPLTGAALDGVGILVLINAYLDTFEDFPAISPPSAFSDAEIETIRKWVENGGSLLMLADHAPLGGGSSKLAAAFGFDFLNGYAAETKYAESGVRRLEVDFTAQNGLNTEHPAVNGSTGRRPVVRFHCFGGQAFIPPDGAQRVLTLPAGWSAIFTYRIASEITSAPRIDASGMAQGATLEFGKGRVAVFTEVAAFSAQLVGDEAKIGFNTERGAENPEFVLALLRWLAGFTPAN